MKKKILFMLSCALAVGSCGTQNAADSQVASSTDAKEWYEEGTWRQGWNVHADKSLDIAEFSKRYSRNSERWKKAFHFLATTDLNTKSPGRYELDGKDLFAIVDEYVAKEPEDTRFEAHQVYADIQYVVRGREYIGVMPLDSAEVVVPYNETKDIKFLHTNDNNYQLADSGKFFIFFPDDAHRPGTKVTSGEDVKKIVVKVRL
jgi:YhcH/YjgK/YiaL family protein